MTAALIIGCDVRFDPPAITVTGKRELPPRVAPFLVEGALQQLYFNSDVDFSVHKFAAPASFDFRIVAGRAAAEGWTRVDSTPGHARFVRITHSHQGTGPCGDGSVSDGSEEVRMQLLPNTNEVIVAYLQVDHLHGPGCRLGEDKFAERWLWPQFAKATARAAV